MEKGFSLIEVVIGISIFAFGVLAVASIQVNSAKNVLAAGRESRLTFKISSEIEKVYALGYDSPELSEGSKQKTEGLFRIDMNIIKFSTPFGLKEVEVSVTDTDNKMSKSLKVYVAQ